MERLVSDMAEAMSEMTRRRETHPETERENSSEALKPAKKLGADVTGGGCGSDGRRLPSPGKANLDLEERFWEAVDAAIGAHMTHG